jgi:molybdopterin/thiamine biosynthesis adenylyltransferase
VRGKRDDGAVSEASTFAEGRRCCKLLAGTGGLGEAATLYLQAASTDTMSAKSANNILIRFILVELRR